MEVRFENGATGSDRIGNSSRRVAHRVHKLWHFRKIPLVDLWATDALRRRDMATSRHFAFLALR